MIRVMFVAVAAFGTITVASAQVPPVPNPGPVVEFVQSLVPEPGDPPPPIVNELVNYVLDQLEHPPNPSLSPQGIFCSPLDDARETAEQQLGPDQDFRDSMSDYGCYCANPTNPDDPKCGQGSGHNAGYAGCWCDAGCGDRGDCCPDVCSVCGRC